MYKLQLRILQYFPFRFHTWSLGSFTAGAHDTVAGLFRQIDFLSNRVSFVYQLFTQFFNIACTRFGFSFFDELFWFKMSFRNKVW